MPAKEECYDHEGRKFNSKLERRKYWGMTACFEYRYSRMGLSFGEIVDKMQKHVFIDHEGNEFPSKAARREFWGIPNGFERICENKGLSFEKTVELYKLEGYTPKTIEVRYFNDPISNKKLTIRELSKKYGIPISTIDGRCRRGLSTACIIGISPAIVNNLQYLYINKKIYGLFIEKRIKKGINVFECYLDGDDGEKHFKIMSQEMIDNYCVEQYKLEHGIM